MLKKILKIAGVLLGCLVLIGAAVGLWAKYNYLHHQVNPHNALKFNSLNNDILDSIGRGVEYLSIHQNAQGAFVEGSLSPRIELTALAVQALLNIPDAFLEKQDVDYRVKLKAVINNAVNYIRQQGPKKDGGIYSDIPGFSVSVYGTAISLVTLRDMGYKENDPLVVAAQKYLLKVQHNEKGLYQGGFGYGADSRPDMSNTVNSLEALEASGLSKDNPAFKLAYEFISNSQNNSETNNSGMAVTDDGGFFYRPSLSDSSKDVVLRDGRKAFASYGAMSYAGLVSFLYAGVDKTDQRVQSAWNWVKDNYDLDENVNRKDVGLYYYYRIMAKALDKYGEKTIITGDGKKHQWVQELAQTMIKLQKSTGGWQNQNSSFMEGDPVLVTAYALAVLEVCYRNIGIK